MEDKVRIPSAEAARRMDTTPRTIRRRVDSGHLRGELIGGRLWIEAASLAELQNTGVTRHYGTQAQAVAARVAARPTVPSVTTGEAARRLDTSRATIHRLTEDGRLRGERIGSQLWVTEESVAALERRGWR